MKPTVYLESSVISYLTARLSRDLIVAAHQQITQEWWVERRAEYMVYVSQVVLKEASGGDAEASLQRLEVLQKLPTIDVTDDMSLLALALIEQVPLPAKAGIDALHMAVAAISGINYLLTWNCKHIANAALRPQIEEVCRACGCIAPIMCTPEELMGE